MNTRDQPLHLHNVKECHDSPNPRFDLTFDFKATIVLNVDVNVFSDFFNFKSKS